MPRIGDGSLRARIDARVVVDKSRRSIEIDVYPPRQRAHPMFWARC